MSGAQSDCDRDLIDVIDLEVENVPAARGFGKRSCESETEVTDLLTTTHLGELSMQVAQGGQGLSVQDPL